MHELFLPDYTVFACRGDFIGHHLPFYSIWREKFVKSDNVIKNNQVKHHILEDLFFFSRIFLPPSDKFKLSSF